MKAITFFSQKGGSGKTTLAVHIAVAAQAAGESVVLLDADPQGSAQAWAGARAEDAPPPVRGVTSVQLQSWMSESANAGASLVIVDAPPHASVMAPEFVKHADLVVIPIRPSVLDLAALPRAVDIIEKNEAKAVFVLSAAKPRVAETDEVRSALQAYPFPCAKTVIHDRTAFSRALATGRAVNEFEPKGSAAAEISTLWSELRRMLK